METQTYIGFEIELNGRRRRTHRPARLVAPRALSRLLAFAPMRKQLCNWFNCTEEQLFS
jgi:hypothetical protein